MARTAKVNKKDETPSVDELRQAVEADMRKREAEFASKLEAFLEKDKMALIGIPFIRQNGTLGARVVPVCKERLNSNG